MLCGLGLLAAERFSPADVKILGDIDYGQTSATLECGETPKYCALVFNAMSGDRVEAQVKGDGKVLVSIADGGLMELARSTGTATVTLPSAGPDPMTFYVVFRDSEGKAGKFTVVLKKL